MSKPYDRKPAYDQTEKIKRKCLGCGLSFDARGRYERLCGRGCKADTGSLGPSGSCGKQKEARI